MCGVHENINNAILIDFQMYAFFKNYALIATMVWLGTNRFFFFFVKTFKNKRSTTAFQRLFRMHFMLERCYPVTSRSTFLLWINNFKKNESALKQQPTSQPQIFTAQKNVMAIKFSVKQSPLCFAKKHAAALKLSTSSK